MSNIHNRKNSILENQAKAWVKVYDACIKLGFKDGDCSISAQDAVIRFIKTAVKKKG